VLHKCNKKVSHLLIFNWSLLLHRLHKCNKNVSHLLIFNWSFLLKNSILTGDWCFNTFMQKNYHSILTGDWRFCYIFTVKRTYSILTGDWRFCYIYAVKMRSFLLHKCNKKVSHLLIFNWSLFLYIYAVKITTQY
jgi:hypothetical protein